MKEEISDHALYRYIEDHTTEEDPLLTELERQTHLRVISPRMISGRVQGKTLEMLSRMIRPKYILEIGTFTGYSALCLAKGLPPEGELHTFEIDDELEALAASFFARSPQGHQIHPHIGSALRQAPNLERVFDLVFIDGDKREYTEYYRMLMDRQLVKSGSYLLADNVLWYGKILEEIPPNDHHTRNILEFNRMIQEDSRVENVILPLRDGMTLIRVI
ncbi:MAG: class I SAM-dependent methyltransferase [Rikenellaceae bacterium]|nr:class I SAM-dependent methyltransferase [Rikenellaceae bacterium]